jgi:hypothetical protein
MPDLACQGEEIANRIFISRTLLSSIALHGVEVGKLKLDRIARQTALETTGKLAAYTHAN